MERRLHWTKRVRFLAFKYPTLALNEQPIGFLVIESGDYIFTHDMWGSGDPLDDVAQAWIAPAQVSSGWLTLFVTRSDCWQRAVGDPEF